MHTPAPTYPGSAPAVPALHFTLEAELVLLPAHVSVPRIGLGQPELAGDRGPAGQEQVELPGLAALARALGGHGGSVCPCAVWEAPPAWHQEVSAF